MLTECLQCKDLLDSAQVQLVFADSLITGYRLKTDNLQQQVYLVQSNNSLAELRRLAALQERLTAEAQRDRYMRRTRTWRTLTFIATGIALSVAGYHSLK